MYSDPVHKYLVPFSFLGLCNIGEIYVWIKYENGKIIFRRHFVFTLRVRTGLELNLGGARAERALGGAYLSTDVDKTEQNFKTYSI